MAKAMLTRPQITSLCVYATSFFTRHSIRHYHSQPFVRVIVNRKLGFQYFLKPLVYTVGGRGSISSGVTSNSSGPIDSPLMQSMQSKIKEELNAELVTVNDAYGDGRHVSIDVVSSAFEGKSAVNRQRMVYKAIWEELQNVVHAVDQMTTRTPEEAASGK